MKDACQHLAGLRVVNDYLPDRLADPLHHAAVNLAGDDHGIEDFAGSSTAE